MNQEGYTLQRDSSVANYATIVITVLIALIGALMMALTSSPLMKGAAFLWLPAALQLIAGVWLGSLRGLIAGGIGAYAAGIIAYQGWGIPDIIMNLIAGGVANAMLPAFLFRVFSVSPDLGGKPSEIKPAAIRILGLLIAVILIAFFLKGTGMGNWGYLPSLALLLLAPLFLKGFELDKRGFIVGFLICIFISFISASIGVVGVMTTGQTLQAAILQTGIGWFLGDTVSCVLGLYMLASFTKRARSRGIVK